MINTSSFRSYHALALALIAGLSGIGSLAISQTPGSPPLDPTLARRPPGDKTNNRLPTPQEGAVMAEFGRGVLAHVDAAAASLAAEDSAQALLELAIAKKLLAQIRTSTELDLIPVFARIGLTREHTLDAETQKRLRTVADLALQGDHDRVVALLEATGAPMGYIHVSMPLNGTIHQVDTAIEALNADRPAAAQTAMDRIIDELRTGTITVGEEPAAQAG